VSKKSILPAGLPAEIGRPLLGLAQRVAFLEPWESMSDLHLIGLRDEATGELQVASILGRLREVFAVLVYRREAGLRWIYNVSTTGETSSDHDLDLEAMDYLKVEWTKKNEMRKPDLETLEHAAFKPRGKGCIWPRFETCEPGWFPWYPSESEARLLTRHLAKILRFLRLRETVPDVYAGHPPGEIPIVPAGEEFSLRQAELEWLPLVPKPAATPEPLLLSPKEASRLSKLPVRQECVFEFAAPLIPELSYLDEAANRPCITRAALLVDRDSHFIFATELAHGTASLAEAAKPTLLKGLEVAQARPGVLHVSSERFAGILAEACASIGVPVRVTRSLDSANDALNFLKEHAKRMR
jgi:hypothetical protein